MAQLKFCLPLTIVWRPCSRARDKRDESAWERGLPDNEKGFHSEFGPRDYRPEYEAFHKRQHFVFKPLNRDLAPVVRHLKSLNAQHRAAFVSAAAAADALFLDLMRCPEPIPVPEPPQRWCAILNDDEPMAGGAKGPATFDQPSLRKLVGSVRTVVVTTVGARAQLYLIAVDRLVAHRENCLLIETRPEFGEDWMQFAFLWSSDCRIQLAKPSTSAHEFLVSTLAKQRDALLGS